MSLPVRLYLSILYGTEYFGENKPQLSHVKSTKSNTSHSHTFATVCTRTKVDTLQNSASIRRTLELALQRGTSLASDYHSPYHCKTKAADAAFMFRLSTSRMRFAIWGLVRKRWRTANLQTGSQFANSPGTAKPSFLRLRMQKVSRQLPAKGIFHILNGIQAAKDLLLID